MLEPDRQNLKSRDREKGYSSEMHMKRIFRGQIKMFKCSEIAVLIIVHTQILIYPRAHKHMHQHMFEHAYTRRHTGHAIKIYVEINHI